MSTEIVMFFWLIHLVIGMLIPALIYCDGCQMREETQPKMALWSENAGVQQPATEIGVGHIEPITMKKEKAK